MLYFYLPTTGGSVSNIGSRVRAARKAAGLSQEGLARLADVSLNVVSRLERGGIADPHVSTLTRIADGLGVPVEELLGGSPKAEAPTSSPEASEAGERRIIDMTPEAFHRALSEARTDDAVLDLYHQIDAEYTDAELALREDESDPLAQQDYARAIERHMMATLSLNIRGVAPPDPEQLALQAKKLEELRYG